MKKILFIIHEASETGAPLVINNLLNTSYSKGNKCFVLSIYGGKIEDNLRNNAQVSVLYVKGQSNGFFHKVIRKFFKPKNDYLKKLDSGFFDLVYINSIASLTRLPSLKFLKKSKTVLHIHEGPVLIRNLDAEVLLQKEINNFSKLIFVSDFVKEAIISEHRIDSSKFEVIPPVIRELNNFNSESNFLKLAENSFVVCSSGSMNHTKGVDVFLQIAKNVINKANVNRPIYFIWIGTNGSAEIRNHLLADIKKMCLEDNVKILPNTEAIISYFNESDVFLLSSREESYSMVAMENAMLGNPVVCFDKGNGTKEFINNENGAVVPYLDIQEAATAILEMYDNPAVLKRKSAAMKKSALEFSADNGAVRIFNLIEEVIYER
ncbi:glycosyltransferase [Flavobacterium rhamnosiphilum]|uniref:Glycosyltransferase n=1 Tax=Flavobacterium rhamnosiphilum TaxID=2541724 RepID=A0A4R5FB76_9FLAO|nr:glycosyltransferase family 4 protein [Flavobacterium rhamnosiphilum]TDE46042.1 glycosyltransferase [Flavobacterium rhamnosiphilum]